MKINGKTKLKIIAEGLRISARRLALQIAHMAVDWLYGLVVGLACGKPCATAEAVGDTRSAPSGLWSDVGVFKCCCYC